MYKSERIYFIDTYIFFSVHICFWKTFAFCAQQDCIKNKSSGHNNVKESLGVPRLPYFLSIFLTSGMNICGVAVFCHCRPFLYSFIKINFTWMSDLICCHIDCRYNIYIFPCNENKFKTDYDVFFFVFCCLHFAFI